MKLKVLSSSCLVATFLMAGATAYAEEIKDVTFSYPINVAEASTPATEQPKEEVKKQEEVKKSDEKQSQTNNNTSKEQSTEKQSTEQTKSVATPATTTAPVVNSNTLPKTSGTSGAIDNFGNTQEGGKVVNNTNVNTSDDKSDKLVEFQPIDNSKKYYLKIGTDGKVLLLTQVKESDLANLIKGEKVSATTSEESKTPVTKTTAPTTKTAETKSGVGQFLVYGILAVLFGAGIFFFKKLKAKRTKDDEEDFLEDNYDEIEDEENENRER